MWLTLDGTAHTLAVPDPRRYLGVRLATMIAQANAEELEHATLKLDALESAVYDDIARDAIPSAGLREAMPPEVTVEVAGDAGSIADAIDDAVSRVPTQWRLDAIMILGDIVDSSPVR